MNEPAVNVTLKRSSWRRQPASSTVLAGLVERLIAAGPTPVHTPADVVSRIGQLVGRVEAARLLGCSTNTVLYHGRTGRFTEYSDGCRLWYDRAELERVGLPRG